MQVKEAAVANKKMAVLIDSVDQSIIRIHGGAADDRFVYKALQLRGSPQSLQMGPRGVSSDQTYVRKTNL